MRNDLVKQWEKIFKDDLTHTFNTFPPIYDLMLANPKQTINESDMTKKKQEDPKQEIEGVDYVTGVPYFREVDENDVECDDEVEGVDYIVGEMYYGEGEE